MNKKKWFTVVLLGYLGYAMFFVQDLWVNTYIYDMISPDPELVALKTGLVAIVATIVTFIAGTLSDRVGRRKPFMIAGFIIWGIMAALLPRMGSLMGGGSIAITLTMVSMMALGVSTCYDSSFQAWVSDITDKSNRGKVFGIVTIMPLVVVLTFGVAGTIIDAYGYNVFFTGTAILFGLGGLLITLTIKEKKHEKEIQTSVFKQLISVFTLDSIKRHKQVFLIFTFTCIVMTGNYIFASFEMIYLENFLKISKSVASTLGLFIVPGTIIVSIIAGKLNDQGKGLKVMAVAPILFSIGCLLFSLGTNFILLGLLKIVVASAITGVMLTATVQTKNLIPENLRGQFEGVRMIFLVLIPMVVGPQIGSFIISRYGIPTVVNGVQGFIPTPILYQVTALVGLLAYVAFYFVIKNNKKLQNQAQNKAM